MNPKKDFDKRA